MTAVAPVVSLRWRAVAFQVLLWGLIAALYFGSPFLLVILGWFQEPFSELGGAERVSHRVHEVLFGVIFAQAMVGAVTQLLRPIEWRAGMLQTVVAVAGFVGVLASVARVEWVGIAFFLLAAGAAVLHPAGRKLWIGAWHPSPAMVGVALVGVLPWLILTGDNLLKAQDQAANHITHWGGVAAFAVVQLLLSIVAALRPPGYRLVALSAGCAGIIYVGASLLFSFDASAEPQSFALWLLFWSMAWLAFALFPEEHTRRIMPALGAIALVVLAAGFGPFGIVVAAVVAVLLVVSARGKGWPRLMRIGLTSLGFFFLLIAGSSGDPSNIPHGLSVAYVDVDRLTCLECHGMGREGATFIPHEIYRACGPDDFCWDGRSDCVGCHQYDPSLQTPATLALVGTANSGLPFGGRPLMAQQLLELRRP